MREAGISTSERLLIKGADMPASLAGMTLGDEGFLVNRTILNNREELVKTIKHEVQHMKDRRAIGDPAAYGQEFEDAARAAEKTTK